MAGAVLQLDASKESLDPDVRLFRGILVLDGLPGPVRADFADRGLDADRAVVLALDEEPRDPMILTYLLLGVAAFFMGAGSALVWKPWKRKTAQMS